MENTNPNNQYPNWVFTFNYGGEDQPSSDEATAFFDALCDQAVYACCGDETAPTTGQKHLQGYVQLKRKRRLGELKKFRYAQRVHWEPARGDSESNRDYCKKEGSFKEFGQVRVTNGGKRERLRWGDALRAIKDDKIDDIHPQILISHTRNIETLCKRYRPLPKDLLPGTTHFWVYGPTGTGKSRAAREEFEHNFYDKMQNKWWDHYNGESNVLIDDLGRDVARKLTNHLKRWLDMYRFPSESKGSVSAGTRPQKFIITSNWHPAQIWTDPEDLEPILRRVEVIYMGPPEREYKDGSSAVGFELKRTDGHDDSILEFLESV